MLCSNGIVIAKHIFFYQVCWIGSEAAFMAAHSNPISGSYLNFKNSCFIPQKLIKQGFQVNEIVEPLDKPLTFILGQDIR